MMARILNPAFNPLRPAYWFGERDTRGLSLFRIVFGLLLLKDALYHLPLSRIFYSDAGVLPLETLHSVARTYRFSLMDAMPEPWMASAFFVLWVVVLINLIVGNRTSLMTVLNFVIILSVHERNTYVLNGADTVMRVMSFWMMFLPLNHHFSIDALRKRRRDYLHTRKVSALQADRQSTGWAFVLRLAQLQIALIYIFATLTKIPTGIWWRGEALYYALQIEPLMLPTGSWLFAIAPSGLLRTMTTIAYAIEASWVIFIFLPLLQPWLRRVGLALGVMFHMGIAFTMAIPNFSLVMIATYLLFVDDALITWVSEKLRAARSQGTVNLYNLMGWRWLLAATLPRERVRVTVTRAKPETPLYDALKYLPLSRVWGGAAPAIQWLAERLMPEAGGLPLPDTKLSASSSPVRHSFWRNLKRGTTGLITLSAMVLVVWWNVAILDVGNEDPLLPSMRGVPRTALQTSGLWQSWKLFAPYPSMSYGWLAVPGQFENDDSYDLRTGEPLGEGYARWVFGPNNRWRKYEERARRDSYEPLLEAWASYYCRTYATLPEGQQLATLEIHYIWRRTPPPGQPVPEYQTRLLWKHWCSPEYAY